jgi:hypothetical protein
MSLQQIRAALAAIDDVEVLSSFEEDVGGFGDRRHYVVQVRIRAGAPWLYVSVGFMASERDHVERAFIVGMVEDIDRQRREGRHRHEVEYVHEGVRLRVRLKAVSGNGDSIFADQTLIVSLPLGSPPASTPSEPTT